MRHSVLVATRDGTLSTSCSVLLLDRGYSVNTASDGLDCLAKLRHQRFDVLLLDKDLLWGGADGVLEWLSQDDAMQQTPVILLDPEAARPIPNAARSRRVQTVEKPVCVSSLLNSLDAVEQNLPTMPANACMFN